MHSMKIRTYCPPVASGFITLSASVVFSEDYTLCYCKLGKFNMLFLCNDKFFGDLRVVLFHDHLSKTI
jgi:hypothetical protein